MNELYKIITESEVNFNGLDNHTSPNDFLTNNYSLKFSGLDEPNYGKMVRVFNLYKDQVDITKNINKSSFYCRPNYFPITNSDSKFIYIPTENFILLINTVNHKIYNIEYPTLPINIKHNFFWKNYLFIIFENCSMLINLTDLSTKVLNKEKINFIFPLDDILVVFPYDFKSFEIIDINNLEVLQKVEININPDIFINSKIKDYQTKYAESDKGFLWSTGHKGSFKNGFGIHSWGLAGYDIDKLTLDIGTSIPVSEGLMDERRVMWFDIENIYIRISINELVASRK